MIRDESICRDFIGGHTTQLAAAAAVMLPRLTPAVDVALPVG